VTIHKGVGPGDIIEDSPTKRPNVCKEEVTKIMKSDDARREAETDARPHPQGGLQVQLESRKKLDDHLRHERALPTKVLRQTHTRAGLSGTRVQRERKTQTVYEMGLQKIKGAMGVLGQRRGGQKEKTAQLR